MCARPELWNHRSWETKASYLMVKPEKMLLFMNLTKMGNGQELFDIFS